MKKITLIFSAVLLMMLVGCSTTYEYYEIPLTDFETDNYAVFQYEKTTSYFTMDISNGYINKLGLHNFAIKIPSDYIILEDSNIMINFEINDYQMCENDLVITYNEFLNGSYKSDSCLVKVDNNELFKEDFLKDEVNVYLIISYYSTENKRVLEKQLIAKIKGPLLTYQK